MKKVLVHFDFANVTAQQYEKVWQDLRASGNKNPKGLLYHVGAPKPGGGWTVIDVWESEQAFKDFGMILMPFIQKNGIPNVMPSIQPVHYIHSSESILA
jgi:hypothetical protein